MKRDWWKGDGDGVWGGRRDGRGEWGRKGDGERCEERGRREFKTLVAKWNWGEWQADRDGGETFHEA